MTAIDSRIDKLIPVTGLSVALTDGVLSVTIDRPESLNSLTAPILAGIADAMEHAATDARVKVVRLGGTGRGFSSGAGIERRGSGRERPGDRHHLRGQSRSAGDRSAARAQSSQ